MKQVALLCPFSEYLHANLHGGGGGLWNVQRSSKLVLEHGSHRISVLWIPL